MQQFSKYNLLLLLALSLAGCGGGGGDSTTPVENDTPVDDTPIEDSEDDIFYTTDTSAGVEISSGDFALNTLVSANSANEDGSGSVRQLQLTWENPFTDNSTVSYSVCLTDQTQASDCAELGSTVDSLSFTTSVSSVITAADNSYFIIADNGSGPLTSSVKTIHPGELGRMAGYFKASNTSYADDFGRPVVISGDGMTMAVASVYEDSESTGLNGDQSDSDQFGGAFGAVYIFSSDGEGNWTQTDYVKASNAGQGDYFGFSLALSEDGLTLAVGAHGEESSDATNQDDNEADYAGAVYIFSNDGYVWSQTAYLKAATPAEEDRFGYSVALSDDGSRLVVGAPYHSLTTDSTSISQSGKAVVFDYSDDNWSQVSELEAANAGEQDRFATDVSISGDGSTIAVSSRLEDSADTGVAGDGLDDDAEESGAVYIYSAETNWSQTAYLKASNAQTEDYFSSSIALNNDGTLLAVSATYEDSNAQGINGDSSNNDSKGAGAVYLFRYSDTSWSEEAYIKGSNIDGAGDGYLSGTERDSTDDSWGDHFGSSVALNGDGTILAVGADGEDSAAIGINWDEDDNSIDGSGAAYLFAYDSASASWSQTAYIKASNTQEDDSFGTNLDLSSDGKTLVVGAQDESSGATGINGEDTNRDDDEDNDESFSGAVYLY